MWWWQRLSAWKVPTNVINLSACQPEAQENINLQSITTIDSWFPGTWDKTKSSLADYSIHSVSRLWRLQELERQSPGFRGSLALTRGRTLPPSTSSADRMAADLSSEPAASLRFT